MTRIASLAPLSIVLAATAFAGAATAQTHAAPTPGMVTYTQQVRYPDAELGGPAGARALLRRIALAADTVCGGEPTSVAEYGANQDYRACMKATVSATVAKLNSPALTAEAAGRRLTALASK